MSNTPDDEINLQELAINIIKFFDRNFKFIFLSSLICTLLGLGAYLLLPPVYESNMVVMSDILPASYSARITDSFQRLLKERNDSILANRLGINLDEATSIVSIRTEKEPNSKETDTFVIIVGVKKKTLFPKLQEGLINYLRNIEFVKIRVRLRERDYRLLIDELSREIGSIDSLQTRLAQGKSIYAKSPEMMLVDPANMYLARTDLQKQLIQYKDSLELFNSIQLVEGFTPFNKPSKPRLLPMLLVGFAAGFFGALIILTFSTLWKMSRSAS